MLMFFLLIAIVPLGYLGLPSATEDMSEIAFGLVGLAGICISPLVLLSVAPAKAVSRRLIFLALGLILLIALNELSKLGPKLHEWGL
jgi:hypothetical protein